MARYDLAIRNGLIVDGARNPRYRADVAIKDGVIVRIGRVKPGEAARVIDATGLVVAPGFIDLHTHYDAQVFWDPYLTTSGLPRRDLGGARQLRLRLRADGAGAARPR
jgi:N-acyl-D-amino-acid deacylase